VEFFGSLRYRIISSVNRDILTVSLPICTLFISFYFPNCSGLEFQYYVE
jgi:hypothetical protein